MARKTSLTIHLTPADRQTLRAWQWSTTLRPGLGRRARMILLRADRATITAISGGVGVSRRRVHKWIPRFRQEGLPGLEDRLGRRHHRGPLPPHDQRDLDVG